MLLRSIAVAATLVLGSVGTGLATGDSHPGASAAEQIEMDLVDLDELLELVDVPSDAEVEVIARPDGGHDFLITVPVDDEDFLIASGMGVGETLTVRDGSSVTQYNSPSSTCTQSQTMTVPLPQVRTASNGRRSLPTTFEFSRSSGCRGGYSWNAGFLSTDPFWGYMTFAQKDKITTEAGTKTIFISSYPCNGTDRIRWNTEMRAFAGGPPYISTDIEYRNCTR